MTIIFTCITGRKRFVKRARFSCSTLRGHKDNKENSLCCTGKIYVGDDEEAVFYLRQDFAVGTLGEFCHCTILDSKASPGS